MIWLILFFLFTWGCTRHAQAPRTEPPPETATEEQTPSPAVEQPEAPPVEPTDGQRMEQALQAYQQALEAWEAGDSEGAMTGLDTAYALLLKVEASTESTLTDEKNDLRLMIARRLVEIFASDQVAVGENHRFIRLEENEHVLKEIKRFQTVERRYFLESYQRSGRYRSMMVRELQAAGLPTDLSWIPLIESGFKLRAYSRARALGLWQFISSTGYRFGLKKDRWVDERMDPVKATRAAVQYLKELHGYFGDWSTALAGYNCGEFRVQRVIRAQRINYLDNFWDLYLMLPRETARFVPRFIATLMIVRDPQRYGFDLPAPDAPADTEIVVIHQPLKLSELDQKLGLEPGTLAQLNPELRHQATPDREYTLRVPGGSARQALEAVAQISRWIPPEATYVIHYVRPGETVSGIASRYRTSSRQIARLNRLRSNFLIRPGQRLKVPARGGVAPPGPRPQKAAPLQSASNGEATYTVKRGDSLYRISTMFAVSVKELREVNNLPGNQLHVGQKLTIPHKIPEGARTYVVQPGDTPYDIARSHSMTLQRFMSLNRLGSRTAIYPGQTVWVE
ncbi:MAG: LysM peptidoglycan-binding domain-containing protein [Candidatus Aminicenantes bacterium]|nr:LysM peptidoglycan-binding domain-containing protein [Candidatus Aminicenantes bacterium]